MNPLRRLFADRVCQNKARNRRSRLGLESLEVSAAHPVMALQPHSVGSTAPAEIRTVHHAAAVLANSVMPTGPETGTAFGLGWRSYYDNVTHQYNVDIQDHQGFGFVFVTNEGGQIEFLDFGSSDPIVYGPKLAGNYEIDARVFANSPGAPGGDVDVGELGAFSNFAKWSVVPRTTTSTVSTPTGPIGLEYDYKYITNSGTLTISDIAGKGTFDYNATNINWSLGDRPVDSPSGNTKTLQSIDLQIQGSGGSDYNGGIDIFHPGLANPTITVKVTNSGPGHYTINPGTGF
jgi:hypothetical protein